MTSDELRASLDKFTTFVGTLKGDEKSEAQIFLDHFFRALGHDGVNEAGATLEFRIAKKPGSSQLELIIGDEVKEIAKQKSGGKKFADLLWPNRVLIEMKSRGEKLEKHYDQAFNYWTHIVPHRPPYVILCNFDEFWIYDFNEQLFDPVDKINIAELSLRNAAFGFLLQRPHKPIFDNNRVEVTRKAASKMADVFRQLVQRGIPREQAQRFILQLLVALVAEDIGLLPDNLVTALLSDCYENMLSTYDIIGGLFGQMNRKQPADGGRYVGVQYFNGGLFSVIEPVELKRGETWQLHEAALEDWSKVKPEIFGTLFQESLKPAEKGKEPDMRHIYGAHFTSEQDIQKVILPTIVRPWRERIEDAGKSLSKLRVVRRELCEFRVLDPACGSGNFLYVAYREVKRLERDVLLRLREVAPKSEVLESAVSLHQFFGLDILPHAVELAKVTLMLAKEQELVEAQKATETHGLLFPENPLPLDNLDQQIICGDALFTAWPKADAIIGNPPYLGSRYIAKEHGYDYANKLYARFPGVPKMADFCTHWFRLAHDALPPGGRAGLVGTNTIRQNESREASLDYVVNNGGTITEAVSSEVWSGEAQVHVSIVNWVKGDDNGMKSLLTQAGDKPESPWKIETLEAISPSLSSKTDVRTAVLIQTNRKPKRSYTGQNPANPGFFLSHDEARELIHADARNLDVVVPYMTFDDLVEHHGPTRWIIDFAQRDQFAARAYVRPFETLKDRVMPDVLRKAEREKKARGEEKTRWSRMAEKWWQFRDYMPGTMSTVASVARYVACGTVTKRSIFEFVSSAIHPDHKLAVFGFADDYSFGILQSGVHWTWLLARCTTLKADFNYNIESVFGTFPWPQSPTKKQIRAVADAAVALRKLRRDTMQKLDCSLRDLYRTLEEPGANPLRDAQAALDSAVRAAYGMKPAADPLTFLLQLNHACAEKEKAGEKITPPGLPLPEKEHAAFVTEDCVKVNE